MSAGPQVFHDRPAPDRVSTFALGNGRLSGKCWGGPEGERICLNHDLARPGTIGGPIPHSQAHLPVGDLFVRCMPTPGVECPEQDYERGLDLTSGTAWVTRRWAGTLVRQRTLISRPANALLHSVTGTGPVDLGIRLDTSLLVKDLQTEWDVGIGVLTIRAELPWDVDPRQPDQGAAVLAESPMRWGSPGSELTREVLLCVLLSTDGDVDVRPDRLEVCAATWAELVLTCEITGSPHDRRALPARDVRGERAARGARLRGRRAIDRGPSALVAEHRAALKSSSSQEA